ncbi:MAG: helix-turn-helix domain-containing protein [Bacteroidetes bacterium]|nr:helix-turn-helix domain-containing protein [Bacteroidota bacterium]
MSHISRIERGIINTSITNVFRIAEVLEIASAKLIELNLESS